MNTDDYMAALMNQYRIYMRDPSAYSIDPIEAFDAAHECKHGNVPAIPRNCGCYPASPEMGDYLNVDQLARLVGKSYLWTAKTLFRLGYRPEMRRFAGGRVVGHFPPSVVPILKSIIAQDPPSGDWVTLHQIARILREDYEWTRRRLEKLKIKGEMRSQPGYGKPFLHYPPDVIEKIAAMRDDYPPAGSWLTTHGLIAEVGRSANWLGLRLAEMDVRGEIRLDDQKVPRVHFSPEVQQTLKKCKAAEDRLKGRRTSGLELRLAIVSLLRMHGALTIPQIQTELNDDSGYKRVYDAALWLYRKNFILSNKTERKFKVWELTVAGEELAQDSQLMT